MDVPASRDPEARHAVIDALRGFALAGVFPTNLAHLSLYRVLPTQTQAALPTIRFDTAASQRIGVLVDGTFITSLRCSSALASRCNCSVRTP